MCCIFGSRLLFLTLTDLVCDPLRISFPKVFAILKVTCEVSQRCVLHGKPAD